MLLGQPHGRRGGGSGQDHFNARLAQQVHHPLEPAEVVFALLRLAEPPGKLSHAHDVDAGGLHQLHVALPSGFRFLAGSSVWEDPLLWMIIYAEIHNVLPRCGLSCTLSTIPPPCNAKVSLGTTILRGKGCSRQSRGPHPPRALSPRALAGWPWRAWSHYRGCGLAHPQRWLARAPATALGAGGPPPPAPAPGPPRAQKRGGVCLALNRVIP